MVFIFDISCLTLFIVIGRTPNIDDRNKETTPEEHEHEEHNEEEVSRGKYFVNNC